MLKHHRQSCDILIIITVTMCIAKLPIALRIYLQCFSVDVLVSWRKGCKVTVDANHALNFTI